MFHSNAEDRGSSTATADGPIEFEAASRLARALTSHWEGEEPSNADSPFPRIGDYLLDRRLGQGGGGSVYHAVLPGWNDDFAIKYLHMPLGEGRAAARARRELDIVEQLDLDVTPRVFEYGVHEGRLFIVSEHVDGVPLDAYCDSYRLDRRERVKLLVRVAHAVHSLHERGVIHRDLKPSNLLVRPDGSPVVIDLGIATLLTADPAETITAEGTPIGSIAYMAPEQARGESTAASIQCDIYGLGATACTVLTGHPPHDIEKQDVVQALQRVREEPIREPRRLDPNLPPPLDAILRKALSARPTDRFASIIDFAEDLQRWLDKEPVRSQAPSWWRNRLLAIRRRPHRFTWVAVGVLFALFVATLGVASEIRAAEADAVERTYAEIIRKTSVEFANRIRTDEFRWVGSKEYETALGLLALSESQLDAGSSVVGEYVVPDAGEIERLRDEFAAKTFAAIYAASHRDLSTRELGLASIRSVYSHAGDWSDALDTQLDFILRAAEVGDPSR